MPDIHLNLFRSYTAADRLDGGDVSEARALELPLARMFAICVQRFAEEGTLPGFFEAAGLDVPDLSWDVDIEVPPPLVGGRRVRLVSVAAESGAWTHAARTVSGAPRLDVVLSCPTDLVVFEFKTDAHPPDAAQMANYAVALGLVDESELPCPLVRGAALSGPEEAAAIQALLQPMTGLLSWAAIDRGLEAVAAGDGGGASAWLAVQARAYLDAVMPQFRGLGSIRRVLDGPEGRELRLRSFVRALGLRIERPMKERGYLLDLDEASSRARSGADSDAFLAFTPEAGFRGALRALQGRSPRLAFWFRRGEPWWGVEFYVQALGGAIIRGKHKDLDHIDDGWGKAWTAGAGRHSECRADWLSDMGTFCEQFRGLPGACLDLAPLTPKGTNLKWQGDGEAPGDKRMEGEALSHRWPLSARSDVAALREALPGLARALWRWPEGSPADKAGAQSLARQIRKPAMSLTLSGLAHPADPSPKALATWLADLFDQLDTPAA